MLGIAADVASTAAASRPAFFFRPLTAAPGDAISYWSPGVKIGPAGNAIRSAEGGRSGRGRWASRSAGRAEQVTQCYLAEPAVAAAVSRSCNTVLLDPLGLEQRPKRREGAQWEHG
jgi:hypothetical protein